jgi:hypothetical protein
VNEKRIKRERFLSAFIRVYRRPIQGLFFLERF